MKKVLSILLAAAMVISFAACGGETNGTAEGSEKDDIVKVGMVCIGNKEQTYDRNFMDAADRATEILAKEGINVEWLYKIDHPVDDDKVTDDNMELAEEGCKIVYDNSYGQEAYMLKAAAEYPDTHFVGCTSDRSWTDKLDNTSNAFAEIYNGRYLAGIAAGMKFNELIGEGRIKEDEAIIGYVGAFPYAEVISGFTAFYLGAKSVCPSATMKVTFINSWGNLEDERAAANSLIENQHAIIISQHSDTISPAQAAEAHGVFHVGYNFTMIDYAKNASLCSPRIDWTNYFVETIRAVVNGDKVVADYTGTLEDGDVVIDKFNDSIIAPGTVEAVEAAKKDIIDGKLNVFDTSKFGKVRTYDSYRDPAWQDETLDSSTEIGLDIDGDFAPDITYKPVDANGIYHESEKRSAPYFAYWIEGIEMVER